MTRFTRKLAIDQVLFPLNPQFLRREAKRDLVFLLIDLTRAVSCLFIAMDYRSQEQLALSRALHPDLKSYIAERFKESDCEINSARTEFLGLTSFEDLYGSTNDSANAFARVANSYLCQKSPNNSCDSRDLLEILQVTWAKS